jgi:hypothetical protein
MDRLYNVYDTTEECYIMLGATMEEVKERFLTTQKMVSQYVSQGYKFQNRYLIQHAETETEAKVPDWFRKQWDEIRQAAEIIENGGHIVTKYKGGKYIHYAEEKR